MPLNQSTHRAFHNKTLQLEETHEVLYEKFHSKRVGPVLISQEPPAA